MALHYISPSLSQSLKAPATNKPSMKTKPIFIGFLVLLVIAATVIAATKVKKEVTPQEETMLKAVLSDDQYQQLQEQYQQMDENDFVNLMVQKAKEYEQNKESAEASDTA